MVFTFGSGLAKGADEVVKYKTDVDVAYRTGSTLTDYMKLRCRLDVYHPVGKKDFATVVWFHGGGLKSGNRFVPAALKEKGIAVVPVNYRLYPKVKSPGYIEDAQRHASYLRSKGVYLSGGWDLFTASGCRVTLTVRKPQAFRRELTASPTSLLAPKTSTTGCCPVSVCPILTSELSTGRLP